MDINQIMPIKLLVSK